MCVLHEVQASADQFWKERLKACDMQYGRHLYAYRHLIDCCSQMSKEFWRVQTRDAEDQFREMAEQVRTQISARPRTEFEFLLEQAARCRSLATNLADPAMKHDLLTLAAELEQTVKRERGDN